MRGQILGVDRRTGEGLVSGDDGRRYTFRPDDWAHQGEPSVGAYVDFDAEQSRARSIFPVPAAPQAVAPPAVGAVAMPGGPVTDRNKYIAAILAFLFGTLGIHRFYLGRTGSGIAMLVLTCTVVGLLVTGLWALVDCIRHLVMSDAAFAARYPRKG
ncbi:TM2 domain-containing protein [Sphingomonas abaci]|uniref:TM2 domain-containing protein n=1 Tax=Sphingomonas abaci TaxID=237611 RepID=A0A7W7EZS2_9SPHN|nr:TM2 domain-containing protein [Sphingomonas abaci]MBB4617645.1 hypothetical protein [Sphingomonas abaci]